MADRGNWLSKTLGLMILLAGIGLLVTGGVLLAVGATIPCTPTPFGLCAGNAYTGWGTMLVIIGVIILFVGIVAVVVMASEEKEMAAAAANPQPPGVVAGLPGGVVIVQYGQPGAVAYASPAVALPPAGVAAPSPSTPCTKCGRPARWVAAHSRWWCDACAKYL